MLTSNSYLLSSNEMFIGTVQSDGNFVIYSKRQRVEFSTNTTGQTEVNLSFQLDGRVCLKSNQNNQSAWWCSDYFKPNMCQQCPCTLLLENDGSLSVQKGGIEPENKYWSSRSQLTLENFEKIAGLENLKTCPLGFNHILNDKLGIFTSMGDRLYSGETMDTNSYLLSPNKMYMGIMQRDGNFAVYTRRGKEDYSTKTTGHTGVELNFQLDGQLCLHNKVSNDSALWCSDYFKPNMCQQCLCTLLLENDGSLSAYKGGIESANKYWSSRSHLTVENFEKIAVREDPSQKLTFDWLAESRSGSGWSIDWQWRENKFSIHAYENQDSEMKFGEFLVPTSKLERHTSRNTNQTMFFKRFSPSFGRSVAEYVVSVISPDQFGKGKSHTESQRHLELISVVCLNELDCPKIQICHLLKQDTSQELSLVTKFILILIKNYGLRERFYLIGGGIHKTY